MRAIWYCCFVGLLVSSCSWLFPKDGKINVPTTLPAITQKGANTFGCLINGELMVSVNKCRGFYCDANPKFDPSIGFFVRGRMDTIKPFYKYHLIFQFDDIKGQGIYSLDTTVKKSGNTTRVNGLNVGKYFGRIFNLSTFDSGTYYHGELNITKWVRGQTGFVSGTFWFDIYNPAKYPDTVRVRDGRFDVSL